MREFKRVAVIIETSSAFGRGLLGGVSRFCRESNTWSVYFEPHLVSEVLPTWLRDWEGDGILARVPNQKAAETLLATGLPLIDLRGGGLSLGLPCFGVDNHCVTEKAYLHLRDCGLEHFAFVGVSDGYYYDDQRREGFQECAAQDGRECHVFKSKKTHGDRDKESHRNDLMRWLESLPKPIGLLCCHDEQGQQVLDACQRAGIGVPDEIAVLGVDNNEVPRGFTVPSLSSIVIDTDRIGYEAARLLDDMMHGRKQTNSHVIFEPGEVVVRQSTDFVACGDAEVAAAIRFIRQHVCHRVTVDDVLNHVRISRTRLYVRFKKVMGRSLKQEILHLQMNHAKMLLRTTDKSVNEIGDLLGFDGAKYFVSVFHKHTGTTPVKYRLTQSE